MAVTRAKLAINNAFIPMLSKSAQRAVVNAGLDAAPRTPRVFMGADDSADYNMATVIYAENVMPAAEGIKSVGFVDVIPAHTTGPFDTIFPLRDEEENAVLFSPAFGQNYVYDSATELWHGETIESIWALVPETDPATSRVTYAYVDGKTFVCYARLKNGTTDMSIMQWDSVTKTLVPATTIIANLPFAAGTIDGISSSSGYLLVWSGLEIAWAFFNGTAFDFAIYANSNFTGSGSQIPEDVQGPIRAVIGLAGGFLAFTSRNCVSANYHSQSISAPWVFKEVADAGGLESYEQATVEGSLAKVMAYTSAGLQAITLNSADHAHPVVADFLTQRETERYDFNVHQIQAGTLGADCFVKITAVGNRYVVVSYGYLPGIYSYALVYDIALQRWGKMRIKHRDCFAFTYDSIPGSITYSSLLDVTYAELAGTTYAELAVTNAAITPAQRALAFMTDQGAVKLATWGYHTEEDAAVAIFGRMQLSRGRDVQFNTAELEGVRNGNVYIQASFDGRTINGVWPTYKLIETPEFLKVAALVDCVNFNLVLEGSFTLSSMIVEVAAAGSI